MGDRCWLQITLHGHIPTIEIFEEVVDAIEAEFDIPAKEVTEGLYEAVKQGNNPSFEDNEINYGYINDLEDVLRKYKIDFTVDHGAGAEYPPASRAYHSSDGFYMEVGCIRNDPGVYLHDLEEAFANGTVEKLIKETQRACGKNLPTFSVGHEVRAWLDIGGPALAAQAAQVNQQA